MQKKNKTIIGYPYLYFNVYEGNTGDILKRKNDTVGTDIIKFMQEFEGKKVKITIEVL